MQRFIRMLIKIIFVIGTGLFLCKMIIIHFTSLWCDYPSIPNPTPHSISRSSAQLIEKQPIIIENRKPKQMTEGFQAGMNVVIYGEPDNRITEHFFERLQRLNVNSVAITFPFSQSHWQESHVQKDATITPTINSLEQLIYTAHTFDFTVMLRPILDEKHLMKTGHWRGNIQPTDPAQWFSSYKQFLIPYVELAEKQGVEIFNIGTEFTSLQKEYSAMWTDLIETIWTVYHGKLIYSFNWDTVDDISTIEFVSDLDYIGVDAYFPLDLPNEASSVDIEKEWKKWTRKVRNLLQNEKIVITEAGVIPVAGAYRTPWKGEIPGEKVDWTVQGNYYEGTFYAWQEWISGLYWWNVSLNGSPNAIDYSPLGSPTEKIIQNLFSTVNK
ncbi:glycoside hydrolase family 113 [Fervidibacillus albus]|uniref:Uncharacterized protein n=1 Tax=Fervidibacillus albus TaxID=2980026 RepID=A0A9E8RV49_9BACI|nr:hypothetical protein [Fervidibacillus albus]WAA09076.1 hypothetical protein OE104_10805 [Fervidibacillus albus]